MPQGSPRHATLWSFYAAEATLLESRDPLGGAEAATWPQHRSQVLRKFLAGMGLDPLPPRCELSVRDYGILEGPGYQAMRLAWQMLPDCWATGIFYLPETPDPTPLPGVLYTCGHHTIGVHGYQHHAIAWARRGYACLMVDTIEQHDNPGNHHGLYHGTEAQWLSLGYSGAGGELWNSIRALDVLASQPEVDPQRIGVTGISGGGAASFFLGVADERVRAAASVAGVSSFGGAVSERFLMRHCDCMYPHNPAGLATSEIAALAAPRALMLAFPDQDPLYRAEEFRLLGRQVQQAFDRLGAGEQFAFLEYPGGHCYQPQTIEVIQQWMDQQLNHAGGPPRLELEKPRDEAALTLFNGAAPQPNRVHLLPELLSLQGQVPLPRSFADLNTRRLQVQKQLTAGPLQRVLDPEAGLAGQPVQFRAIGRWVLGEGLLQRYQATIGGMEVAMTLNSRTLSDPRVLIALADPAATGHELMGRLAGPLKASGAGPTTVLTIEPRGTGLSAPHPAQQMRYLRAGALVGLTPPMLWMQDLRHLLPHLLALPEVAGKPLYLYGQADAATACVYTALFEEKITGLLLDEPPPTHRLGTPVLGILRVLDLPQAIGLLAPRPVALLNGESRLPWPWRWPERAYERLAPGAWLPSESLSHAAGQLFAAGES